jgi:hypothetical protein
MRIALLAVTTLFAAMPVAAEPTAQVAGGSTRVRLSEDFVAALGALGVTPGEIEPGELEDGRARFPIPGGALDLATARGDVFHLGGLALTAGDIRVGLLNFVIDTTPDAPVLTGVVTVDGDLVARVPLFDLGLTQGPELSRKGRLEIEEVELTLTAAAAEALNEIFGVDAFFEGFDVGVAKVKTRLRATDDDEDEDDD